MDPVTSITYVPSLANACMLYELWNGVVNLQTTFESILLLYPYYLKIYLYSILTVL